MKIASWNVNGVRASIKSGLLDWLERERPDVACLQETKCAQDQLSEEDHARITALGYKTLWHCAERRGYSGVATFTRKEPLFATYGVPFENREGRVLVTEHGDFTLYNVYFPNGRQRPDGPDPERLRFKLEFYDNLLHVLEEERAEGKHVIVSGDWNTAHCEIDIARPRENANVTGFTPVEREALHRYVERGWIDTFRYFHPPGIYEGKLATERDYTWWPYWAGARDRNIGWRIDYHFTNAEVAPLLKSASIQPSVMGSDHCPVLVELKL
jgi:exodeoxyribonuclease-3